MKRPSRLLLKPIILDTTSAPLSTGAEGETGGMSEEAAAAAAAASMSIETNMSSPPDLDVVREVCDEDSSTQPPPPTSPGYSSTTDEPDLLAAAIVEALNGTGVSYPPSSPDPVSIEGYSTSPSLLSTNGVWLSNSPQKHFHCSPRSPCPNCFRTKQNW